MGQMLTETSGVTTWGFSEANAKEGYLVDYVILKTNLSGFKTLVAATIRVNTL